MNSPEIVLSFNEVMFYFSRAAVGVGVPYGLADDYGRSSIWIAAGGLDPAVFTSNALKSLDLAQSSLSATQTKNGDETVLRAYGRKKLSSLLAGPSVCDWITSKKVASNKNQYFIAKNVDLPFLLSASVGALNYGNWEVSWQDSRGSLYSVLTAEHGKWKTSWDADDISLMSFATDVTIRSVEKSLFNTDKWNGKKSYSEKNRERVLETGVKVYKTWPIIYSYFSRCLVTSTVGSRKSGAGAGFVEMD